jgi:LysM repeat protein
VPVRTLIETNGLKLPYCLAAASACKSRSARSTVQSGDTLLAISRIYGVDQSSLASVNNPGRPMP